ncbi:MAG: hypothetical protein H6861_01820 [Rhodospirillales bacterium]|nr:hypothetical protein [Rhodospirillales bacterium]
MIDTPSDSTDRPDVGTLVDFVIGAETDNPLYVEVAIKDDGRVVLFHDKPFKKPISWFEFDLNTNKFDFIMENGELRDFGLPLRQSVAKHMQNSHQILTVLLDDESGEGKEGHYIPLIIHSS